MSDEMLNRLDEPNVLVVEVDDAIRSAVKLLRESPSSEEVGYIEGIVDLLATLCYAELEPEEAYRTAAVRMRELYVEDLGGR